MSSIANLYVIYDNHNHCFVKHHGKTSWEHKYRCKVIVSILAGCLYKRQERYEIYEITPN